MQAMKLVTVGLVALALNAQAADKKAAKPKADKAQDMPCGEKDGEHGKGECACPGCMNRPTLAVATMHPTAGNKVTGTVKFTDNGDGTLTVEAQLEGLVPGQLHAMHVHEFGDCSAADGSSAGGHYNPENHPHGLPEKDVRHAGDFGNVPADAAGKATYTLKVNNLSVGHKNAVLGRAVIVHAKQDDGGQPTGNAGGRVACGVVGVAKTAEPPKAPEPVKTPEPVKAPPPAK